MKHVTLKEVKHVTLKEVKHVTLKHHIPGEVSSVVTSTCISVPSSLALLIEAGLTTVQNM